ncbi:hypothetical protein [Acidovorax sp. SDU_ACID1]
MADWLQGCARALSFFGGVAQLIADAILDRLMQQNHRLTLTGESLRQKPK